MIQNLLGTSVPVFIAVTLVFMGGCAFMTGRALAQTWRPAWQLLPYALMLGMGDRFVIFSLFDGELLSPSGYLIDTILLLSIAVTSWRVTLAGQMVRQYPWLYVRKGPFRWSKKEPGEDQFGSHKI